MTFKALQIAINILVLLGFSWAEEPTNEEASTEQKVQSSDNVLEEEHELKLSKEPSFIPDEGYQAVSMAQLADYKLNSQKPSDLDEIESRHFIDNQIPVNILRLKDQQIQIEGFAYPLELEGDKTTVFLLLPGLMSCCFSKMPELNEYVYVEIENGVELKMDAPHMVHGVLNMGDKVFKTLDESVIYHLKATKVKLL